MAGCLVSLVRVPASRDLDLDLTLPVAEKEPLLALAASLPLAHTALHCSTLHHTPHCTWPHYLVHHTTPLSSPYSPGSAAASLLPWAFVHSDQPGSPIQHRRHRQRHRRRQSRFFTTCLLPLRTFTYLEPLPGQGTATTLDDHKLLHSAPARPA